MPLLLLHKGKDELLFEPTIINMCVCLNARTCVTFPSKAGTIVAHTHTHAHTLAAAGLSTLLSLRFNPFYIYIYICVCVQSS